MKNTDLEWCGKFARRIVDRFDLTPPIDVSNIFSEMDIQIVEEENQYGIEAYSQLNDNKVIINTEITYIHFTIIVLTVIYLKSSSPL